MELFKSPLATSGCQALTHPLTGEPIIPVGKRADGRPIWPIMGGAPDDDDTSGSSDKDEDEESNSGDSDGDDDKDEDEDDDESGSDSDTVSKADYLKLQKKLKASDRNVRELGDKLKSREDKDKDDLTKATDRVTELEGTLKEQATTISQLRMANAFLTANTHNWHDSDMALEIASSKGYLEDVVDDDGDVDKKALKKALDKLAKEHKYLVKSKSSKEDEDSDEDDTKRGPSGQSGPGRTDSKDKKRRRTELSRRMPALNR